MWGSILRQAPFQQSVHLQDGDPFMASRLRENGMGGRIFRMKRVMLS